MVRLGALPAIQVAYLRAIFGLDDTYIRCGDDRAFDFLAGTVGKSCLWHLLVSFECLADTDACESQRSRQYRP